MLPGPGSEFAQKRGPVAFDRGTGIVLSEAEIEIALAIYAGRSAGARGKAVHQPRKLAQMLRAKNCEFRFGCGPGCHISILTEPHVWSGRATSFEPVCRGARSPL